MRRYRIVVTGPNSTASIGSKSASFHQQRDLVWDSQNKDGTDNTEALDIAFDLTVGPLGLTAVGSYVEVFGVSLQDVANVRRWQGGTLSIYGGFSAGFPLANTKQYGLLARGTVLQAFGNWTGTHQSVSFVLTPAGSDKQVVFHWQKGMKLSQAITTALNNSYRGFTVKSQLQNDPVAAVDDAHYCPNLYTFVEYITRMTYTLGYATKLGGIQVRVSGTVLILYDSASPQSPNKLEFNDFQGQPVNFGYGGGATVQAMLNLRYDLSLGVNFSFPQEVVSGFLINNPMAPVPLPKNGSTITGTYMCNMLRHVGRFRDPMGTAWTTIVDGVQL